MTIIIPGGHLTPALAVIDYILEQAPDTKVVFLGRIYSQDNIKQKSHEATEIAARPKVTFLTFDAPRLRGKGWQGKLGLVLPLIRATYQSWLILQKYQPNVVVSFGGYQAVPLALAAKLRGVPILTHEQTRIVGQATNLIARWAKRIAVSYESSIELIPASWRTKVIVTGNPVRASIQEKVPKPEWVSSSTKPVLFVTGGNQGALAINQVVGASLAELTKKWQVVHQCGNPTLEHDYVAELQTIAAALPSNQRSQYHVQAWYSERELAWIWQHTQAVVCRAGANTVSEVMLFKVPSIFIPLPAAINDEQLQNIQELLRAQAALHLSQAELNPDALLAALATLDGTRAQIIKNLSAFPQATNASQLLWQEVQQIAS